jgi:putative transport protein
MPALSHFVTTLGSSASALVSLSLAITLGLLLGRVRVRGVSLGIAGVLFAALALAQAGVTFQPEALPFVRDFALVLFVYGIGLQVGPSFFASFRAEGLRLNLLAAAVILLAAALGLVLAHGLRVPEHSVTGVYSGALTSTPALAAGQVVIRQVLASDVNQQHAALATSSLAYAVTYPFGVVGPIVLIVMLRRIFGVRMEDERAAIAAAQRADHIPSVTADVEVAASAYAGRPIRDLPRSLLEGIVLSRLYRGGELSVPRASTVLQLGDVVRAFGPPDHVQHVIDSLGRPSTIDLSRVADAFQRVDLVVTRSAVLRRPLRDLGLRAHDGVTIAQIHRAGIELIPHGGFTLKFGDHVTAVGPAAGIAQVAKEFGNEPEALDRPYRIPVFIGLALGVLVGAIPVTFPGLPAPLQIGLAGGPFLVALAPSQLGSLGPIVWYMPVAANRMVQDLGLSVFLACIGFQSGEDLLQRAIHAGPGLIVAGALVTLLPALIVACVARHVLRMNFITFSGWLAGTMTSTPALVFATEETGSDDPALAYASVVPLCEILPIVCAESWHSCSDSPHAPAIRCTRTSPP